MDPESVLERIEGMQRDKENRLQEMRREQEYQELRDCTFQPERVSTASVPKAKGPVVVRGLGRYLELQELARRQQEDKRMLEEKLFKANPRGNQAGYTVPKPFKLSLGREAKRSIRKQQSSRQQRAATGNNNQRQEQHQQHQQFEPKLNARPLTRAQKRQAELNRILYA
jgi:hypothetical protein